MTEDAKEQLENMNLFRQQLSTSLEEIAELSGRQEKILQQRRELLADNPKAAAGNETNILTTHKQQARIQESSAEADAALIKEIDELEAQVAAEKKEEKKNGEKGNTSSATTRS